MDNQPARSSLRTELDKLELNAAADLIDARQKILDEREASILKLSSEQESRSIALDAQIAHKRAQITNLTNKIILAEKAVGTAENDAREKIAKLEADISTTEQKLSTANNKLAIATGNIEVAEGQYGQLKEQITESSGNVILLEDRIIELKQQAQYEQNANKQAIDELSSTVSDMIDQKNQLEHYIAEKKEKLRRLDIKIEATEARHNKAKTELEKTVDELTQRVDMLRDRIAAQEAKLDSMEKEELQRATINLTKDRELQAKEDRLNEWAKELGYKERKVQSDLSLR